MPLNVFHFQIWATSVGWKQATGVFHLVFVLLIELKHFKKVVSMDQFVLELLSFEKFSLQERSFNVDVMFDFVQ